MEAILVLWEIIEYFIYFIEPEFPPAPDWGPLIIPASDGLA